MKIPRQELVQLIDSTLIKPAATKNDIIRLCREAKKCRFGHVVVNPCDLELAHSELKEAEVKVCSTVGFARASEVKAEEANRAVKPGAQELDMVMNIGAFKSKDYDTVKKDIEAVVAVKHTSPNILVKVIIETELLTDREKAVACQLVKEAKADFVKTSTGFLNGGATTGDVKIIRRTVGREMGVKAAGGIRTLDQALSMIKAGANRIRTSTAMNIIREYPENKSAESR